MMFFAICISTTQFFSDNRMRKSPLLNISHGAVSLNVNSIATHYCNRFNWLNRLLKFSGTDVAVVWLWLLHCERLTSKAYCTWYGCRCMIVGVDTTTTTTIPSVRKQDRHTQHTKKINELFQNLVHEIGTYSSMLECHWCTINSILKVRNFQKGATAATPTATMANQTYIYR